MSRKCSEYVSDLNDYLDGEISPELCEQIEKHIGECRNCRIMVDSLKQTVSLVRENKVEKLPPQLEEELGSLLKRKWREKFQNPSSGN